MWPYMMVMDMIYVSNTCTTVMSFDLFIYFDLCLALYTGIFHFHDCDQHYGWRNLGSAPGKSTTIHRLLQASPCTAGEEACMG